jgi:hypothetical protein
MADLEREDIAAFMALLARTMVPVGGVTASTFKVLNVLQDLGARGGVLTVPALHVVDDDASVGVSDR